MALDPSIALQVRGMADPLESVGKVMSLKGLATQQQLHEAQFAKYEQDRAAEQKLNDLYRGNIGADGQINRAGVLSGAAGAGLGSRIPGLQKGFAEADKEAANAKHLSAQTAEIDFGLAKKKLDAANGVMASLLANPNLTHDDVIGSIVGLVKQGYLDQEKGAQMARMLPGDAGALRNFLQQKALETAEAGKRLDALTPNLEKIDNGKVISYADKNPLTNQTQQGLTVNRTTTPGEDLGAKTAAAGQAVTMRGQNMVDARSREATAATMSKPFEVTGPDNQPVLVQQDKRGSITPVQGFGPKAGAAKPLTEAQGKATNFAARMQDAESNIQQMEAKGISGSELRTIAASSVWTNFLASPEGQQYRQAQENWITANLRQESGAAIGKDEMTKDVRKFFPVPGDSGAVIQQKAQARRVAQQGMLTQAGPGAKEVSGIVQKATIGGSGPKPGTVEDGHVFIGGDPSDPASWKAVGK